MFQVRIAMHHELHANTFYSLNPVKLASLKHTQPDFLFFFRTEMFYRQFPSIIIKSFF